MKKKNVALSWDFLQMNEKLNSRRHHRSILDHKKYPSKSGIVSNIRAWRKAHCPLGCF